jgi:antitoxin component of RelBE/YafQ-DinJ toxin-antitoxin module
MGTDTASRSRRLLTFRLDRELRQRLKARLAGEGRTMSEVVILGLQLYVQHSTWFTGGAMPASESSEASEAPEASQALKAPEAAEAPEAVAELPPAEPVAGPPAPLCGIQAPAEPGAAPATTVVASAGDLVLPDHIAAYLRDLRECGHSDLLSAALTGLHDVGWPLRPLAAALGISRQAVLVRIRQQVPPEVRSRVPEVPPPSAFPRRRPALASGRRPHLTVKIDHALRAAAHRQALREGSSLSQVIEKILDHYLRHGMPTGEVLLGDTTPTRPAARRRRRA